MITGRCWLVSRTATVRVVVQDGIVTEAAPLVQVFTGQPLHRLTAWFGCKFGPCQIEWEQGE